MNVDGVGLDAVTVTNEAGGRQSAVLYRFDLLDPAAMFAITKVLAEGAVKYGESNWRNIEARDHLNHMLVHAYAWLAGDETDEHLSHVFCRAMMAMAMELESEARGVDDHFMSDIRNTSKPNMISEADMGELTATTPSDAVTLPTSDGDTWAADPMSTNMVGGKGADTMDHNSQTFH